MGYLLTGSKHKQKSAVAFFCNQERKFVPQPISIFRHALNELHTLGNVEITKALFSNAAGGGSAGACRRRLVWVPAADAALVIQDHSRSGADARPNAGRA
jgi:hypothetical protein